MPDAEHCPNPLTTQDATALIGLTATLHALVWSESIRRPERERLRARLRRDGLIPADAPTTDDEDLRDALDALNQRLRWVLGEYDSLPA